MVPRPSGSSHALLRSRLPALSASAGLLIALAACGSEGAAVDEGARVDESHARPDAAATADPGDQSARPNVGPCGFTADFHAFLASERFAPFAFERPDLEGCSSYGGRGAADARLAHDPVVFVHGNSDRGFGGPLEGWNEPLAAFEAAGYTKAELYAFTWGSADANAATLQYHSRANLERVRAFLEAVLAYTGAAKIDVVAHSMGVTLSRKAIAGGAANDALGGGAYDLGAPLTEKVDTFVGIAGGNVGLTSCWFTGPTTPTCGATNGYYPGTLTAAGIVGRSAFLEDLLERPHTEGAHVYSVWSAGDKLAGTGAALVWGQLTARIPEQDGEVEVDAAFGHMGAKTKTGLTQIALVRDHALP